VDREPTRRHLLAGLGGASALFLGAIAATFDPPRVASVESESGTAASGRPPSTPRLSSRTPAAG
jgi:hypothetical protein